MRSSGSEPLNVPRERPSRWERIVRALWWTRLLAATLAVAGTTSAVAQVVVWTYEPRGEKTSDEKKAAFNEIIAAYNARNANPATRVTVKFFPFDGFADRISASIPRGKGPDLFFFPQDRLGGWAKNGNTVEPLDRFVSPKLMERFIPATMQAMKYDGHVYGLPFGFNVITVIYNKKLVPKPPRTTAELRALAKKFIDRKDGTYGFVYDYSNYYFHAALQNGFGGSPFDDHMQPVMNRPENVRAMNLLLSWLDLLPKEAWDERNISLFNEGKTAMVFSGPWILGDISKSIDYGLAPLPAISEAGNRPMRPWITVDGLYMAAPSKQKEAAFEFMKYITDLPAARTLALEGGGGNAPANQSLYLDAAVAGNEILSAFFKQVTLSVAMPNGPEMTMMWPAAFIAMNSIVSKSVSPEAALLKAQMRLSEDVAVLHNPPRPPPRITSN
jgi:arabinogalactan oligomer/maltooligosaccharide transport system substrate-binding protein